MRLLWSRLSSFFRLNLNSGCDVVSSSQELAFSECSGCFVDSFGSLG